MIGILNVAKETTIDMMKDMRIDEVYTITEIGMIHEWIHTEILITIKIVNNIPTHTETHIVHEITTEKKTMNITTEIETETDNTIETFHALRKTHTDLNSITEKNSFLQKTVKQKRSGSTPVLLTNPHAAPIYWIKSLLVIQATVLLKSSRQCVRVITKQS